MELPYKIECKSTLAFYETIAAFNCERAALAYAGECALTNMNFSYRVKRGRKTIQQYGPEQ